MSTPTTKKRPLSLFGLVMINIIAIDSLRNLPANAQTGYHIIFYYAVCALFFLVPCMLITAELASNYPKRGGIYVWVREAFGQKMAFITIWLQWVYSIIWCPTILTFLATNIAYLINPNLAHHKTYIISMVIGLFALATIINNYGMKISGRVSAFSAMLGTILPMFILTGLGFIAFHHSGHSISLQQLIPTHMNDSAFIVIVIFSLVGVEMSAVHAQEVLQPEKNYPKALVISSSLILLTLVLSSLAIVVIVPTGQLGLVTGLDQAFDVILTQLHMTALMPIVVLMIIIGGFGCLSAWVIGPSKSMMTAANDGCLPKILKYRNKHQAPTGVLLLQLLVVIALTYLIEGFKSVEVTYWLLSDLTAQLAMVYYIIFFVTAIKLHASIPESTTGFRIPGGRIGSWATGLTGIVGCIGAITVGFIPPTSISDISFWGYENFLLFGILTTFILPIIIYHICKKSPQQATPTSTETQAIT